MLQGRARDAHGRLVVPSDDAVVVWAVTSANHQNTRRNPVPDSRREAAMYADLGFDVVEVEEDREVFPEPPVRPRDVLERVVADDPTAPTSAGRTNPTARCC